jgi:hypothetical protein
VGESWGSMLLAMARAASKAPLVSNGHSSHLVVSSISKHASRFNFIPPRPTIRGFEDSIGRSRPHEPPTTPWTKQLDQKSSSPPATSFNSCVLECPCLRGIQWYHVNHRSGAGLPNTIVIAEMPGIPMHLSLFLTELLCSS